MNSYDVAAIVPKLGPSLYRFFLSRMPAALADEAVQEVFLRLILPNSFDSKLGKIDAYVWGLATNVQRELLRKQGQMQTTDTEYEPEAEPEENRAFAALRQAVGTLDEPESQIFQMVLADLSIGTISENLQMPEGTVKSHIHRGKEKLKRIMMKWGYE